MAQNALSFGAPDARTGSLDWLALGRLFGCSLRLLSTTVLSVLFIGLATLLSGCGGGGADTAPTAATAAATHSAEPAPAGPTPPAAIAVSPTPGTLLQTTWSAYPRLVRLAHQADPARNGRVVASLTERDGGRLQAGFHASADDGAHFQRIGTLADPAFGTGLCCGTLYELPQTVGALAAGTLLYTASVGADTTGGLMQNAMFRSDDGGAHFRRIDGAQCGQSTVPRSSTSVGNGSGIWEPEFLMAADGSLACVFSDETVPNKSQVLRLTRTVDGVNWSAPRTIVAGAAASDRPGMAGVRRLPGGRYLMVFELCSTAALDCATHIKTSADGLDWGAADDMGQHPQTATGQFFRHAPTLAWAPAAGSKATGGALLLIGQILASANGQADAALNGRVLLVNDAPGIDSGNPAALAGPWRAVAAPIGLAQPPASSNWCQNYSSPLLPRADGSGVLLLQTDRSSAADDGCSARFGSGAW